MKIWIKSIVAALLMLNVAFQLTGFPNENFLVFVIVWIALAAGMTYLFAD